MKLTTKIMLCLLIVFFGFSLAFIVGFSRSERTHYNEYSTKHYSIPQDSMATVETGKFRVVRIEEDDFDNIIINDECSFRLISASVGAGGVLQIPESIKDCIDISHSNDTLVINIRINDYVVSGLNLTLAAERVDIVNNFQRLKTVVEGFDTDTIFIRSAGYISICRCQAKVLDYDEVSNLNVKECEFDAVNIDLDKTSYQISDSKIKVENLTGRGSHSVNQPISDPITVNWIPKTEDAALNIKFSGDSARIDIKNFVSVSR
jgi:hypothetical protein